jgi:hypothetical protein
MTLEVGSFLKAFCVWGGLKFELRASLFFFPSTVSVLLFYKFFNCCVGWGHIVTFTKVLTIYQIYHT